MLTITNLTRKQKMFCEIFWSMDTAEQIDMFIRSLPKTDRKVAQGVFDLMVLEMIDQELDDTDLDLAKQVIDKVR